MSWPIRPTRFLPTAGAAVCGLFALFALACGPSAILQPTHADADRISSHFPDASVAELAQGRQLYVGRCGSCHVLKLPHELPPDQWAIEVNQMRKKNGVRLNDAETQAVIRYLWAAATAS